MEVTEPKFRCGECGKTHPRSEMAVKKVSFMELGLGGKMIRARTVKRLCQRCMVEDADWNVEARSGRAVPVMAPTRPVRQLSD